MVGSGIDALAMGLKRCLEVDEKVLGWQAELSYQGADNDIPA